MLRVKVVENQDGKDNWGYAVGGFKCPAKEFRLLTKKEKKHQNCTLGRFTEQNCKE